MHTQLHTDYGQRYAGFSLIAIAVLLVFAMLHHPVPHGHGFEDFVIEVQEINLLNQVVHGSAILMLITMLAGLTYLGDLLGKQRFSVRLGLISTGTGCLSMILAAMVSGFIVPSYLNGIDLNTANASELGQNSTALLQRLNQCFDLLGVASLSAGAVLFGSAGVLQKRRYWSLSLIGLTAGTTGIVGLFFGFTKADVSGVQLFAAIFGVWLVAVGIQLAQQTSRPIVKPQEKLA